MRHLAFLIGERRMALPLSQTVGIVPATSIRRVPGLRPGIKGLCVWNATLVPIVSLEPVSGADQLVLLSTHRGTIALEVSGVLGIHPAASIERQVPSSPDSPPFAAGAAVIDGKSHALLDAEGVADWIATSKEGD